MTHRALAAAETLFGHTWPVDRQPFEAAFAKWLERKTQYEEFAVRGLTVNERLHAFRLATSYDHAVAAGDLDTVRRILAKWHVMAFFSSETPSARS